MKSLVSLMVLPFVILAVVFIFRASATLVVAIDDVEANAVTGGQTGCVSTQQGLAPCGFGECDGAETECDEVPIYDSTGPGSWQIKPQYAACHTCGGSATCSINSFDNKKVLCQ